MKSKLLHTTLRRILLLLCAFAALPQLAVAQATITPTSGTSANFLMQVPSTFVGGDATIMGYADGITTADLTVENSFTYGSFISRRYYITAINESAFANSSYPTSLYAFGTNLYTFGDNAFAGCSNFKAVVFPNKGLSELTLGTNVFPDYTTVYVNGSEKYEASKPIAAANNWLLVELVNSSNKSGLQLISDDNVYLSQNETEQIELSYYSRNISSSSTTIPRRKVTFSSVDESIATVSELGVITAVAENGATDILVSYDGSVQKTVHVTIGIGNNNFGVVPAQKAITPTWSDDNPFEVKAIVKSPVAGAYVEWSLSDESLVTSTTSDDGLSLFIVPQKYGSLTITATYKKADGTTLYSDTSTIDIISTQYNTTTKCINPLANHVIIQEISYAGRGNNNEPLTRVLFNYPNMLLDDDGEDFDATDDLVNNYSVKFIPYFESANGHPEITTMHAYLRVYPQAGCELRGNAATGAHGGYIEPNGAIDLGVFDYRAPTLASEQVVFDLGVLNEGENVISGQEYEARLNTTAVTNMINYFTSVYNTLEASSQLAYFDPRFYIYICADINENCSDMNYLSTQSDNRNKIGCVVTEVGNKDGVYTGKTLLSGHYKFVSATGSEHWDRAANSYHIHYRDQVQQSRTILWRRIMAYTPFDGYSKYYRIPGLTNLSDGTLVLTSDARKFHNHDISNNLDVISRVSTDNGRTWSQPNIVAQGYFNTTDQNCDNSTGFGDAAVGDLPTPGNVIAVFIGGNGLKPGNADGPNISYSISTTSGRSWSEPQRIDKTLFSYDTDLEAVKNHAAACPGPGRMCTIQTGKHAGKVVFCAYMWAQNPSSPSGNNLSYYGPLTFLAYDETTMQWENLGHLGEWDNFSFGESQLVEVPQFDSEGNAAEPKFLLTVRNENSGDLARSWFLLTPNTTDNSKPYFPTFDRGKYTNFYEAWAPGNTNGILRVGQTGSTFGYSTGGVNSNFYIYENTNGTEAPTYYLVQAMATNAADYAGDRSNGGYCRSQLELKMADITDLVNKGELSDKITYSKDNNAQCQALNWIATLQFSDPLDKIPDGQSVDNYTENGYVNAGYSCVSYQTDGKVGIATEEFPFAYYTAKDDGCDKSDMNRDYLLGGWYSSVSLESLSMGNIEEKTTGRELPKPEIWPYNSTFKIDCTGIEQPTDADGNPMVAHAGQFVANSTHTLPLITFTVDPTEVQINEGEKWRIDYDVYYRMHNVVTGVKLFDFMSTWYNPTYTQTNKYVNEGQDDPTHTLDNTSYYDTTTGKWTLEIELPMEHEDFLKYVSPIIKAAYDKYGEVDDERDSGYMHTGDSFVVRARVGVYPADYYDFAKDEDGNYEHAEIVNNQKWTEARLDQGVINTTGYYAVSPSRKLMAKIRPAGINAEVEMSSEFATAIFNNKTNIPNNDASNLWMFGRPSFDQYTLRLAAKIPDESPATFLGFSLNGENAPVDENGVFNTADENLIRNQWAENWIDDITYYDEEQTLSTEQQAYMTQVKEGEQWKVTTYGTVTSPSSRDHNMPQGTVLKQGATGADSKIYKFNTHVYDDPQQLRFYVPSVYTYTQPENEGVAYDPITFYAWFASLGGVYTDANLAYQDVDLSDIDKVDYRRAGAWTSDLAWKASLQEQVSPGYYLYDLYKDNRPKAMDEIAYPLKQTSKVSVYDQEKSIDLSWNTSDNGGSNMGFDMGYLDFSFTPDRYGYKNSAVITVWRYNPTTKGYELAESNRAYTYDENGELVYVPGGQGKVINIAGLDYRNDDRCQHTWASSASLPTSIKVPVSFSGCLNGDYTSKEQVDAAWAAYNKAASASDIEATENTKMPLGMILVTVTDKPVVNYEGGNQYVDAFIDAESKLIQPADATPAAYMSRSRSIASEVADDFVAPNALYRVAYPLLYNGVQSSFIVQTGIDDINVDLDAADDAQAEYYTIMGQRVANPTPGNIYIVRRGAKAQKVLFR